MKIVKCLMAVALLVITLFSAFLTPFSVNAASIDGSIIEPQYSVIRCDCGGSARYIRDVEIDGKLYGEFYCPSCQCNIYL